MQREASNGGRFDRQQGAGLPLPLVHVAGASRLVTLDHACGQHITAHGFEDLAKMLRGFGCTTTMVTPGVILLRWPNLGIQHSDIDKALGYLQHLTRELSSSVFTFKSEDLRSDYSQLLEVQNSIDLSCQEIGQCDLGLLLRVTGRRDRVQSFLQTISTAIIIVDEMYSAAISEPGGRTSRESRNLPAETSKSVELTEEVWQFLKLTAFERNVLALHPLARVDVGEPGRVTVSGSFDEVQKVVAELYRCLDSKKTSTYWKSKAIVKCLKLDWGKVLLQNKWAAAQVKAVVIVAESDTATICCCDEQDLPLAMRVLETTFVEEEPISLPHERHTVDSKLHSSIEGVAENRAVALIDHTQQCLIVAGKADELGDVVNKIRVILSSLGGSKIGIKTVAASAHVIDVIERYYLGDLTNKPIAEEGCCRIRLNAGSFVLEGDDAGVAEADQKLKSLISQIASRGHVLKKAFTQAELHDVEAQTCTVIELVQVRDILRTEPSRSQTHAQHYGSGGDQAPIKVGVARSYSEHRTMAASTNQRSYEAASADDWCHGETECDLKLLVIKGSICEQVADVLVNSVHFSLDLSKGEISRAFLKVAGPQLQRELDKHKSTNVCDFTMYATSGCNLRCHVVLHVLCGPYSSPNARERLCDVIYGCLREAEYKKKKSIVFPAIGTGGLGYPTKEVALAFYAALDKFNKEGTYYLKSVTCAIFDDKTYREFLAVDLLRNDVQTRSTPGRSSLQAATAVHNYPSHSSRADMAGGVSEVVAIEQATTMQHGVTVIVWGMAKNIDDAIVGLVRLDTSDQAKYLVSGGTNNSSESSSAGWTAKAASAVSDSRNSGLMGSSSTEKRSDQQYVPISIVTSGSARGIASTPSDVGKPTSRDMQPRLPSEIPEAGALSPMNYAPGIVPKEVLQRMTQQYANANAPVYPEYWDPMGYETLRIVNVQQSCQEYQQVESQFRRSMHERSRLEVVEIIRIQDKTMWLQYCFQQDKMERMTDMSQKLWFVCPAGDITSFLKSGTIFNRSSTAQSEYGKGVYFYRNVSDAARLQLQSKSTSAERNVILATVLTGRCVRGEPSMITLPLRPDDYRKYDCSVDSTMNPAIFVIFHDAQACPLYLIKFREVWGHSSV